MTVPLAFEVHDQWGRIVRLAEYVWNDHILGEHGELTSYLNSVRDAVVIPHVVCYDADRPDGECFYRFGAVPAFPHRYLKVTVRFIASEGGIGYVNTAYVRRNIRRKERMKWQR